MSTSVVDLLNHVGVDNVRVQFLDDCVVGATATKRGARVEFLTENMKVNDLLVPGENVGLIVWVPRIRLPKWAFKSKEAK